MRARDLLVAALLAAPTAASPDVLLWSPGAPEAPPRAWEQVLGERAFERTNAVSPPLGQLGAHETIVLVDGGAHAPDRVGLARTLDARLRGGGRLVLLDAGNAPRAIAELAGVVPLEVSLPAGPIELERVSESWDGPYTAWTTRVVSTRDDVPLVERVASDARTVCVFRAGDGRSIGPALWTRALGRGTVTATCLPADPELWSTAQERDLFARSLEHGRSAVGRERPPGALPVFEGSHAGRLEPALGWSTTGGTLLADEGARTLATRAAFTSVELALEYRFPDPERAGARVLIGDGCAIALDDAAVADVDGGASDWRVYEGSEWRTLHVRLVYGASDGEARHDVLDVTHGGYGVHVALPIDAPLGADPSARPVRIEPGGAPLEVRSWWVRELLGDPFHPAFEPRVDARERTDVELRAELDALRTADSLPDGEGRWEALLAEVARRADAAWGPWLRETVELRAASGGGGDLEPLTVLRRLEGRPDPLAIRVRGPRSITATFPELPTLSVAFENVDVEGRAFTVTRGGDYRSGRSARWRVELRDADGRAIPVEREPYGLGGGLHSRTPLQPGESWEVELPLGRFAVPTGAGPFTLIVQYHDAVAIAGVEELDGYLAFASDPRAFAWRAAPAVDADADRRADAWLARLDPSALPLIVASPWQAADGAIPADVDPRVGLYRLGPAALPAVLEALDEPELEPGVRAQLLGLATSITGLLPPSARPGSLPGEYLWASDAAALEAGVEHGARSYSSAPLEIGVQAALAARWAGLGPLAGRR